jgi:hypothetical protein
MIGSINRIKWNSGKGLTADGSAQWIEITKDVTQDELQSRKMKGEEWIIRKCYG